MSDSDSDIYSTSASEEEQTLSYACLRCPGRDFPSSEERDKHIKEDHVSQQITGGMARRGGGGGRKAPYTRPMAKRTGTPVGPQASSPATVEETGSEVKNGRIAVGVPKATRGRAMKTTTPSKSSDSKADK